MDKEKSLEQNIIYYYCELNYSTRQTASVLSVHKEFVLKFLRNNNLIRSKQEGSALRSNLEEYKRKLSMTQIGTNNHQVKLNEEKVISIRSEFEELLKSNNKFQSEKILAKKYNVARTTIADIIKRRTWKHI